VVFIDGVPVNVHQVDENIPDKLLYPVLPVHVVGILYGV
jgi:hypothetical protein